MPNISYGENSSSASELSEEGKSITDTRSEEEKPRSKNSNRPTATASEATGYPLFIFARESSEAQRPTIESKLLRLKAAIKRKIPGARILDVMPLTIPSLENAFISARNKSQESVPLVNSALLIVIVENTISQKGLHWKTKSGMLVEEQWLAAINKLSKSIFGTSKGKLETVLLLSDAGSVDCEKFPGPLFGMTPVGYSIDWQVLWLWVNEQIGKAAMSFPISAREWFDSWAFTNKLSRRKYFYCPTSNNKGYLGYKKRSDPSEDNGGVEWDIN